jgi:hypothetical protein
MAIKFPNSFLNSLTFIFYGNTGTELLLSFHDVQDLEQHIINVRQSVDSEMFWKVSDFTENIYSAFHAGEDISIEDAKRFLYLCPDICDVLDFVEDENALQILKAKYPEAMCR